MLIKNAVALSVLLVLGAWTPFGHAADTEACCKALEVPIEFPAGFLEDCKKGGGSGKGSEDPDWDICWCDYRTRTRCRWAQTASRTRNAATYVDSYCNDSINGSLRLPLI
jgi:hypothetical protein